MRRRTSETSEGALGQPIAIDNKPFTVVGVTRPGFFGVDPSGEADLYLPMRSSGEAFSQYTDPHFYWIQMMGRLRPGVTKEQAEATLAPMFQQYVATTASVRRSARICRG